MADHSELLGLDVGTKHLGVARVSTLVRIPEPLTALDAQVGLAPLLEVIAKQNPSAIVIGLPRNLNGNDTPQTTVVREWAGRLKQSTSVPLFWQDEALTSVAAEQFAVQHDIEVRPGTIDSLAACQILADFLATPETQRSEI